MSDYAVSIGGDQVVSVTLSDHSSPVSVEVGPIVGLPGASGASSVSDYVGAAAVQVSGHRAVVVGSGGLIYADPMTASHAALFAGVTMGASAAGGVVTARAWGLISEPSWAWVPGVAVRILPNGVLSQMAQAEGAAWDRVIGYAVTPTSLFVSPLTPIFLESSNGYPIDYQIPSQ